MDNLGNINASEGVDRCECGCKYWENDRCVDCGTGVEIVWLRRKARDEALAGRLHVAFYADHIAGDYGLNDYSYEFAKILMEKR